MNRLTRLRGRDILADAAVVLAVVLTGCAGNGHIFSTHTTAKTPASVPSSTPSAAPAPTPVSLRIPASVRKQLFSTPTPTAYTYAQPKVVHTGSGLAITQRRLPECDSGPWAHYAIDQRVNDFASSVAQTKDGYIVARQLTVYPTTAAAEQFLPQMEQHQFGCGTFQRHGVDSSQNTYFVQLPYLGLDDSHDGTMASESIVKTAKQVGDTISVLERENNAIVYTQIVNPHYAGGDGLLMGTYQDATSKFANAVRRAAARSAAALNGFK